MDDGVCNIYKIYIYNKDTLILTKSSVVFVGVVAVCYLLFFGGKQQAYNSK